MVLRKKNLLDAFRQAAPEGRKPGTSSGDSSSRAGGPFAPPPPRASSGNAQPAPLAPAPARATPPREAPPADPPEPGSREPGKLESLLASKRVRAVVLLAALIGLGGYVAGRFVAKPSQAGERGAGNPADSDPGTGALSGGAAAGESLAERNQAAARMGTAVDKTFMEPANRFTIRLIQYKNDEAGQERARETAEYLRKQAIPVVSPISLGKNVILCADAKPRIEDLAGLLKHLKLLPGAPPQDKQTPYSSAYVVNIDDVVKRR